MGLSGYETRRFYIIVIEFALSKIELSLNKLGCT